MDWMTEEAVIRGGTVGRTRFVGTRLSLAEHQRRTVHNYLELRHLADDLPIVPVLQGQSIDDYKRIIDAYHRAGVDLHREPLVGLGSVCRRQATRQTPSPGACGADGCGPAPTARRVARPTAPSSPWPGGPASWPPPPTRNWTCSPRPGCWTAGPTAPKCCGPTVHSRRGPAWSTPGQAHERPEPPHRHRHPRRRPGAAP